MHIQRLTGDVCTTTNLGSLLLGVVLVFCALSFSQPVVAQDVNGNGIIDSSIESIDIRNNTITGADILTGTITSSDIANGTITGTDIANGSVASADITDNSVTGTDIRNGTA